MADERTRIEKLLAMAQQDESPNERDQARARLATMGHWPPPPKPPAPAIMGEPEPWEGDDPAGAVWTFSATSGADVLYYRNGEPVVRRTPAQAAAQAQAASPRSAPAPTTTVNAGAYTTRMFRGGPIRGTGSRGSAR